MRFTKLIRLADFRCVLSFAVVFFFSFSLLSVVERLWRENMGEAR